VGKATALFPFPARGTANLYPYMVSSDGRRFLILSLAEQRSVTPVTVLTNWLAAAKRAEP
jgi:hypothetical protein